MFSLAGSDIPIRVQGQMRHDEAPVTTLAGLRESGFLLTDRRLFAWRENGAGAPLPLPAIERILIDEDGTSAYHHVVVLPRQPLHPAMVLTRRRRDLDETLDFVGELAAAIGVPPREERLGSIHRVTFPAPLPG
jgi:hypothetical protein